MIRAAIVYGGIAGTATIITMILGFEYGGEGAGSQAVGFLIMFIALSLIFFGIKRYRDVQQGGVITFAKAFGLGAMMAACAGIAYVVIWEAYLASTDFAFINQYFDSLVAQKEAAGVTGAELQDWIAKNEGWKTTLQNPFWRIPIWFTEIFPIGLIVAFISALILRKPEVLPASPR